MRYDLRLNALADGSEHELVMLREVSFNGKGYLFLGTLVKIYGDSLDYIRSAMAL